MCPRFTPNRALCPVPTSLTLGFCNLPCLKLCLPAGHQDNEMKTFPISTFLRGFKDLLRITVTLIAMTVFSACAGLGSFFKQADSALPIEVVHARSGQIMSFRAHETSDRLYVAGIAKTFCPKSTTHVDVQLIGPAGNVIAKKQDDIDRRTHPRTARSRGGHHSYVASFPLSEARHAAKIRVICHGDAHSKTSS